MELVTLLLGVACTLIGWVILVAVKEDILVHLELRDGNYKAVILPSAIIIIGIIVAIISFCLLIF